VPPASADELHVRVFLQKEDGGARGKGRGGAWHEAGEGVRGEQELSRWQHLPLERGLQGDVCLQQQGPDPGSEQPYGCPVQLEAEREGARRLSLLAEREVDLVWESSDLRSE